MTLIKMKIQNDVSDNYLKYIDKQTLFGETE